MISFTGGLLMGIIVGFVLMSLISAAVVASIFIADRRYEAEKERMSDERRQWEAQQREGRFWRNQYDQHN